MRAFIPLLLALAACGADVKTTTIRNADGNTVTVVAAPAGTVASVVAPAATTSEPWPADAPVFAPEYPGATVTTVAANLANGSTGSIITFNTPDSPTAVVAFYQAAAQKAAIPRVAALSTDQSSLFSAGDPATGRALTIQAAARPDADGGTHTAAALTISNARQPG